MTEKHFFADVDLPFHVWVRERSASGGMRWVLREAPQSEQDSINPAAIPGQDRPPTSTGASA